MCGGWEVKLSNTEIVLESVNSILGDGDDLDDDDHGDDDGGDNDMMMIV